MAPAATYLDLAVGPYRLALPADCVLAVTTEMRPGEPLSYRGEVLPYCDLVALFTGRTTAQGPSVAVCFESGDRRAAVGVDRVAHLRVPAGEPLLAVPRFALRRPELFTGILRDANGLLLALSAAELAELTTPK
jgi:chemotaxis signal transduction protein